MPTSSPYGSWRSPITAGLLVEHVVGLSQLTVQGDVLYWTESRPSEGGRVVIVRKTAYGDQEDLLPAGWSARTLVHEYGGQSFAVGPDGSVFFSNFADQRMYRIDRDTTAGSPPTPLTAEPPAALAYRYADPIVSPDGRWVVCVRERHEGETEAVNEVVAIPTAPGDALSELNVLASGHDFFSAPRLSPNGELLCWLSWDHPNMPWDGTELWVAPFANGQVASGLAQRVAGGSKESVSQPRWSPDGRLHYASDRTGWWNLYVDGADAPLAARDAEFSGPDWAFGQSTYAFLPDGALIASWSEAGLGRLGIVADEALSPIATPYSSFSSVKAAGAGVVAIAGSPVEGPAIVRIDIPSGAVTVLRRSRPATVDASFLSVPKPVEFPTEGGLTSHALFYEPRNADFAAPDGELPPLIVMSHGGPTGASSSVLNLAVQYWTSRGFAVVDVNYGGSSGYGRSYRARLQGTWGIVDVDDCANAARWLATQRLVDGDRMVIRGGSAGGFTTLAALTFGDVFAGGASHFGVADLEALATDTHKFESRYLDGLIGPYPSARDVYIERSPIHHTDRLSRPMILFQGLEDKVVPPEQAEMMAEALRAKGIPFAYLAFEGEQHGFRKAETIKRVAEAELWFYGRILGFSPGDEIAPVPMENEAALTS